MKKKPFAILAGALGDDMRSYHWSCGWGWIVILAPLLALVVLLDR